MHNTKADISVVPGTIEPSALSIKASVRDSKGETHTLRVPMPGMHNLSNALAAIAAASASGVGVDKAVAALGEFHGPCASF